MISSLDIVEEVISKLDDVTIGLWKNEKRKRQQNKMQKKRIIHVQDSFS